MTTLLDWDLEAAAGPRTPCLTKAAQGQIEVVVGVQRSGKAPCTGEREPTIRPRAPCLRQKPGASILTPPAPAAPDCGKRQTTGILPILLLQDGFCLVYLLGLWYL